MSWVKSIVWYPWQVNQGLDVNSYPGPRWQSCPVSPRGPSSGSVSFSFADLGFVRQPLQNVTQKIESFYKSRLCKRWFLCWYLWVKFLLTYLTRLQTSVLVFYVSQTTHLKIAVYEESCLLEPHCYWMFQPCLFNSSSPNSSSSSAIDDPSWQAVVAFCHLLVNIMSSKPNLCVHMKHYI